MGERSEPADGSIDFPRDDRDGSTREVDTDTYVSAFNAVALPPDMPADLKTEIDAKSDQARDLAEESGFARARENGSAEVRIKGQHKQDEDEDDNLSQLAQMVRQEREEREREEWSRTRSTVAGVSMTGAEWAQFADRLRFDDDLRRRLIETFERQGATKEEADTRVDRAAAAADAASVPPGQRDDKQRAVLADTQVDADLRLANSYRQIKNQPATGLSGSFETAAVGKAEPPSSTPEAPSPRPITIAPSLGF